MRIMDEAQAQDRRSFLKAAACAGSLILGGRARNLMAQIAPNWKNQIGLQIYTVRVPLAKDYEGTLAQVAAQGYTEIEPSSGYNNLEPAQYKALLDKYGLKMYSSLASATDGPDLEKQLEGHRLMGIRYEKITPPRQGRGGGAGPGGPGGGGQQQPRPPQTVDSVHLQCEQMNKYGAVLKKFDMKFRYDNHAAEFELLDDGKTTQWDLFLAETDPGLVALELDVGFAYMAGQDVLAMIKKHPRFELWQTHDAKYKQVDPTLTPTARQRACQITAFGEGEVDYKAVFALAELSGLKHFFVEQDTAGQGARDALGDCKVSYDNLRKLLS
jgi:sugar phosphate isomerase/epimerase